MNIDRLIAMANDIGAFFDAGDDKAEAARGIAGHLQRFWDPRMRAQILAHEQAGGAGLHALVREGLRLLAPVAAAALASGRSGAKTGAQP
jgi:formate dehydrogenase subunit delta